MVFIHLLISYPLLPMSHTMTKAIHSLNMDALKDSIMALYGWDDEMFLDDVDYHHLSKVEIINTLNPRHVEEILEYNGL